MAKVSFTTKGGKKVSFTTKAKKAVKKVSSKLKKTKSKKTKSTKSKSSNKKSLAGKKGSGKKKGIAGMTRLKKFLLGVGVGTGVTLIAGATRVREVEFVGPIIDAGLSGGIEGQAGVALPKIIALIARRSGFNFGNGGNGNLAMEGA